MSVAVSPDWLVLRGPADAAARSAKLVAWFARWRLAELAGVATFAVFFCVFAPKMFARVLANDFAGFYSLMRVLTPLLILGILFFTEVVSAFLCLW